VRKHLTALVLVATLCCVQAKVAVFAAPDPKAAATYQRASLPILSPEGKVIGRDTDLVFDPRGCATAGYSYTHVVQWQSGICTFGAALASAASQKLDLASRIEYQGQNVYKVFLFEAGWQEVYFDGTVYVVDLKPTVEEVTIGGQTRRVLRHYWPLLFARAYLQYQGHVNWRTDQKDDARWFASWPRPPWTSPENASFSLGGGDKNNFDTDERNAIPKLKYYLLQGSICTVNTNGDGKRSDDIWGILALPPNHMWAILGFDDATQVVTLYNPWGGATSLKKLPWSEFKKHFTTMTFVDSVPVPRIFRTLFRQPPPPRPIERLFRRPPPIPFDKLFQRR
jgi:hypothetical protein